MKYCLALSFMCITQISYVMENKQECVNSDQLKHLIISSTVLNCDHEILNLPELPQEIYLKILKNKQYKHTRLGFVGVSEPKMYNFSKYYSKYETAPPCNLNSLKIVPTSFAVKKYEAPRERLGFGSEFDWGKINYQEKPVIYIMCCDGINKNGHCIGLPAGWGKKTDHTWHDTFDTVLFVHHKNEELLSSIRFEPLGCKIKAVSLHYGSNRAAILKQDSKKNNQVSLVVCDFDYSRKKEDGSATIDWVECPIKKHLIKYSWLTRSTGIALSDEGNVYIVAQENNNVFNLLEQKFKYANKNKIIIKNFAVNYLNPRQLIFTDSVNLFYTDLLNSEKIFIKIDVPFTILSPSLYSNDDELWYAGNKFGWMNSPNSVCIHTVDILPKMYC